MSSHADDSNSSSSEGESFRNDFLDPFKVSRTTLLRQRTLSQSRPAQHRSYRLSRGANTPISPRSGQSQIPEPKRKQPYLPLLKTSTALKIIVWFLFLSYAIPLAIKLDQVVFSPPGRRYAVSEIKSSVCRLPLLQQNEFCKPSSGVVVEVIPRNVLSDGIQAVMRDAEALHRASDLVCDFRDVLGRYITLLSANPQRFPHSDTRDATETIVDVNVMLDIYSKENRKLLTRIEKDTKQLPETHSDRISHSWYPSLDEWSDFILGSGFTMMKKARRNIEFSLESWCHFTDNMFQGITASSNALDHLHKTMDRLEQVAKQTSKQKDLDPLVLHKQLVDMIEETKGLVQKIRGNADSASKDFREVTRQMRKTHPVLVRNALKTFEEVAEEAELARKRWEELRPSHLGTYK